MAVGFGLGRHRDGVAARAGGQYVCPMHPQVTAEATGECPICGMALLKVGSFTREEAPGGASPMPAGEDALAVEQLMSHGAGGVAPNLVGYYPSPVRKHVLRYELYAPAWVQPDGAIAVVLYADQVPTLEPGERAIFAPTAEPRAERQVGLAPGPAEAWDRSTSLVRFAAAGPALEPGTVGWVKLAARPRPMTVIPANAVLESPEGPYVLVVSRAQGTAHKRAIEIGRTATGLTSVLAGLALHEQVVSVNAFFWDAERRLHADRVERGARSAGGAP